MKDLYWGTPHFDVIAVRWYMRIAGGSISLNHMVDHTCQAMLPQMADSLKVAITPEANSPPGNWVWQTRVRIKIKKNCPYQSTEFRILIGIKQRFQEENVVEVKDVMRTDVPYVRPSDSIKKAARKMRQTGLSFLPVNDEGKLRGVIKESAILDFIATGEKNPEKTCVKSMTDTQYPKASPGQDLLDAARIMARRRVEELPITQNGRFLGVLVLDDMVRMAPATAVLAKADYDTGVTRRGYEPLFKLRSNNSRNNDN